MPDQMNFRRTLDCVSTNACTREVLRKGGEGWGRRHTYLLVAVVVNLHGFQIHGVLLEGSQRINAAAHYARNVGAALLV